MTRIHPTACVEPTAELAEDVVVGPYTYVGPHVVIGRRCHLRNNVTLTGHTTIGDDNVFYANTVIGEQPQDLKYKGGATRLVIGDRNSFREGVTVHAGTEAGGSVTTLGSDNHVMVGVHVGHDAQLGNCIIAANNTLIAGHVRVEDGVTIGGAVAIHHFCTIGRYSYIAGMTRVTIDVPPFMIFAGYEGRVRGMNAEGLRRWNFRPETIAALKRAYLEIFSKRALHEHGGVIPAIQAVDDNGALDPEVAYLVRFVKRSLFEGVRGRHLESKRMDKGSARGQFYQRGRALVRARTEP